MLILDRRTFIINSLAITGGLMFPSLNIFARDKVNDIQEDYYKLFKKPDSKYFPFVRWWWNGNKVEKDELVRELNLLKEAGIGGVEINPVKFPSYTDDMGKKSLQWLSNEWIDMLSVCFDEAKKLDMTCDLIVGSGWPFGGEFLELEERGKIMVIGVKKVKGPTKYEISLFNLFKEADPSIGHPHNARVPQLIDLKLVPDPISNVDQIIDLSSLKGNNFFSIDIPEGNYTLYALVKIDSFGGVINGVSGADGPALDHLNVSSVKKYLNRMSDKIQGQIGPLSSNIRALFTDSMELEGANWCNDMASYFKERNGYDIMPYLAFTMYKIGSMGNVTNYGYGAKLEADFKEMIDRMRYDFEDTKADLFLNRFSKTYVDWCHKLGVQARAQAYGRGFYPLETSMLYDIPEGESWTTNWLQHRIGEEMSNEDYRRGRAYTMINKYVSSAAHLTGKRLISAEEMTNTYRVFNMSLEFLKIGCDQNTIAGITHSVFHGFNYSPPDAPFPGWVRYGSYYNEKNNWWPYFKYFNEYRARISSMLQQADMYADIAILPPVADMWTTMGMQNEPFPSDINVPYQSLLWETMHKTGNGADYVSENIICEAEVKKGYLHYGKRKYKNIFLIEVEHIQPSTLAKIYDFVLSGGRVFCIEKFPAKSLGWFEHKRRDLEVENWVSKLKKYTDRFILLEKPKDNDFLAWYPKIQSKYSLTPFIVIEKPNPYVMVNRYIWNDNSEFLFFSNSSLNEAHQTNLRFVKQIANHQTFSIWDPKDGKRYSAELDKSGKFPLYLGPAESLIIVFDRSKSENKWTPLPISGNNTRVLEGWEVEFHYSLENKIEKNHMYVLEDLKGTKYIDFSGTVKYQKQFNIESNCKIALNLGKVWGVAVVIVNGKNCGVSWYGNRIYDISDKLQIGQNEIEIQVVTTMGNYLQTMKDNKIAQRWTNSSSKPQPKQSMGLAGPVTIYEI